MREYKIGLGIIKTQKEEVNNKCIFQYTDPNTVIHVHTDINGIGIAKSNNNCIKYLYDQGCDFIFLMDVDCYPLHSGWEEYFISCHKKSGIHFFEIPEPFKDKLLYIDSKSDIGYYSGAIGCFHMLTRKFVDTVGYLRTDYSKYGFEHAGYMNRACRSGLYNKKHGGYPCPLKANYYIYSEDVYGARRVPSTLSWEEKQKFIEINRPIYEEEITSNQIYYPYEQN
jgi:hypothetical protein